MRFVVRYTDINYIILYPLLLIRGIGKVYMANGKFERNQYYSPER